MNNNSRTEKIKNARLSRLTNNEHYQYQAMFIRLVNEFGAEILMIEPLFEIYIKLFEQEDNTINKIYKSSLTETIRDTDRARDEVLHGMIKTVKLALKHFNDDVKSAAKRLKIVFDTYGDIAKMSLNQETAAISNILQELSGAYKKDVETTGIKDWVSELERKNIYIDKLITERFYEDASKTTLVMKQVRAQVDDAYHEITRHIEALYVINKTEVHRNFIQKLNVITEKYNNTLAQRIGRKKLKNKKTNEEIVKE
jgi:hypothetical protein